MYDMILIGDIIYKIHRSSGNTWKLEEGNWVKIGEVA